MGKDVEVCLIFVEVLQLIIHNLHVQVEEK